MGTLLPDSVIHTHIVSSTLTQCHPHSHSVIHTHTVSSTLTQGSVTMKKSNLWNFWETKVTNKKVNRRYTISSTQDLETRFRDRGNSSPLVLRQILSSVKSKVAQKTKTKEDRKRKKGVKKEREKLSDDEEEEENEDLRRFVRSSLRIVKEKEQLELSEKGEGDNNIINGKEGDNEKDKYGDNGCSVTEEEVEEMLPVVRDLILGLPHEDVIEE